MGRSKPLSEESLLELGYVFILSLPSFTWVRAPASTLRRIGPACEVVGQRQMLVAGGSYFDVTFASPSQRPSLLQIFDLTDLTWKDEYNRNPEPYSRPTIVDALYENGKPKATVTWETPELEAMFQQTTSTVSGTASSTGSVTGTPEQLPIKEKKASLAGPIAGGVVAGIAVISIVVLCLWLRRRKHQKQATDATQADASEGVREIDGSQVHEMGKSNVINEVDGKTVPPVIVKKKPVPPVEMA